MPSRPPRPRPHDRAAADPSAGDGGPGAPIGDETDAAVPATPDLSALPIAGIGRRQLTMILGAVLAVWIIAVFARQVGDASAASSRAEELAAANNALRADIDAYRRELEFIQRQEYILIEARSYGLGKGREIPFSLSADAPPLAPDAPGSASVRVGAEEARTTPFERWMELLFGPG